MISHFIGLLIGVWMCAVGYGQLSLGSRLQEPKGHAKLMPLFRIGGPVVLAAHVLLFLASLARPSGSTRIEEHDVAQLAVGEELRDPASEASFEFLQRSAGSPGENGWTSARSLGCGFSVDLVGPYNEFKTTAPTTDGSVLTTYTVGTQTSEGCKLLVSCLNRDDGTMPPDFVETAFDRLIEGEPTAERFAVVFHGHNATRVRVERSGSLYGAQLLLIGNTAYHQSIECPESEEDYFDKLEATFFESLDPALSGASP